MSKKRKKGKRSPQHTPLAAHSKEGSKLLSPLSTLPIQLIDWQKDLVPEYLVIAALAEHFGIDGFHKQYNRFIDILDMAWPHEKHVCLGLVSDFDQIPPAARQKLLTEHRQEIHDLFFLPGGRFLAFYPDSPVNWLCIPEWIQEGGSLDPEVELPRLRRLVVELLPGRNPFASRVRVVPLARILKHGKLFFAPTDELPTLLLKYPHNVTNDEALLVESAVRALMHTFLGERRIEFKSDWARVFWRKNYDLVRCRELELKVSGEGSVGADYFATLEQRLRRNAELAGSYIQLLATQLRIDLYDPIRDEVLFGLFSRATRLYCAILEDPLLWARDVSGIFLRCLAETCIVFGYLARRGTAEEFKDFVAYGEGQQKLLMLHLQDNYPSDTSLEGLTDSEISSQLGGFHPEFMDIELGHWTKKDTRWLAEKASLLHIYRLVFTPTSGDIHGTWWSIRNSNLSICGEPLHRFHRRPQLTQPPFFVNTVVAAQRMLVECAQIAIESLGYPSYPELQAIEPPHSNAGEPEGEEHTPE